MRLATFGAQRFQFNPRKTVRHRLYLHFLLCKGRSATNKQLQPGYQPLFFLRSTIPALLLTLRGLAVLRVPWNCCNEYTLWVSLFQCAPFHDRVHAAATRPGTLCGQNGQLWPPKMKWKWKMGVVRFCGPIRSRTHEKLAFKAMDPQGGF